MSRRPGHEVAGGALRLRVDMIACDGHGVCAEVLPEWVGLDDWGYPILQEGTVPTALLARARWAVANCPALALRLEPSPAGRPRHEASAAPSPGGAQPSSSRRRRRPTLEQLAPAAPSP